MNELVKFNEVQAEISQFHAENEAKIFEYETPQGNKDARSWIFKLRKVKTKIADVHKIVKAEALAVCQKVDMVKRELTGEVETMIAFHETPLLQIETREAAKKAEELRQIQLAKEKAETDRLEAMRKQQEELDARAAKIKADEAAVRERENKIKAEEEARAAAKQAEIDRIANEKRIAEEAKIKAKQAAKQALIDAEKKRLADIAAVQAKAKADADAKELVERRRKEKEAAEAKRLADIEAKRQANKAHRKEIEDDIYSHLVGFVADTASADKLLLAIKKNEIPNLIIWY